MLPIWQQINGSALENNAIYKNSFLINVIPVHLALRYTDHCVTKLETQSAFKDIRNIIFTNIKSHHSYLNFMHSMQMLIWEKLHRFFIWSYNTEFQFQKKSIFQTRRQMLNTHDIWNIYEPYFRVRPTKYVVEPWTLSHHKE